MPVRSFLDKKVAPLVAAHERARTFPWELLPQLYDFGYVRGGVPEAVGGDGLPMMMQAILMEEAGRCWGSLRTTLNVQGMVARVLGAAADAGQAQRFLRPLLEGRRFGWFGLTEPDAGSDAGALRTTARAHQGRLGGHGSKLYITNALGCDFGILFVRVVDSGGTDHGVTGLLVDAAESEFGVHDIPHMPLRSTTELRADVRRHPRSCGERARQARRRPVARDGGRQRRPPEHGDGRSGAVAGLSRRVDQVLQAARAVGKPIAAFQLVQQMVVEIATLTETSRLLGYHAARTIDAGEPGRYECSMAKYYCGESVGRAATLALQLHGGAGLMEEITRRAVLP